MARRPVIHRHLLAARPLVYFLQRLPQLSFLHRDQRQATRAATSHSMPADPAENTGKIDMSGNVGNCRPMN